MGSRGVRSTYDSAVSLTLPTDSRAELPSAVPVPGAEATATKTIFERLYPPMPAGGWRGWVGPLAVTVLALLLRLPNLGTPRAVVFDETYYVKDGLSLLQFGYERQSVEGADKTILDATDADPSALIGIFKDDASFVVHPPVGKWIIGVGEHFFGVTPFGWRIGVCVLGVLAVLLAARITRRLTRSNLFGTLAGLLVAIDGLSIVMSRTALLDTPLMFFVLVAFGALLLDRDRTRKRLGRRARWHEDTEREDQLQLGGAPVEANPASIGGLDALLTSPTERWGALGPGFGLRPWRIVAGVALGLACGVKWSGLYYVIAFGLLTVLWDVGARKAAGVAKPRLGMLVRDALPAFVSIVVMAGIVYLGAWSGWLLTAGGYDRQWATDQDASLIPAALRSLWHYHVEAWNFHVGLTSEHSYQANAWGWPVMARPTSFFYESPAGVCGSDDCAQEVTALGNPIIWWAGALALFYAAWRWFGKRDWRSGAILCGFLAGWLPWLFFQQRTVFTFYSIVFEPFVVMALVMLLGAILGPVTADGNRRVFGAIAAGGIVLVAIMACWFFLPVWTGIAIPHDFWQLRMWFPTWV